MADEATDTAPSAPTRGRARPGLTVQPGFESLLAANGLTRLDDLFAIEGDHRLAKPGLPNWRERLRLVLHDSGGPPSVFYLKRYAAPPLGQQIRRILTGQTWHGTAWAEWDWMQVFARCGIEAVRPVAVGEEMAGPWERRSALMTPEVPGESLERWVARHPGRAEQPLARALASAVARLHRLGFVHRDLYLSHVFLDRADDATPMLRFIDLQRVLRPRWRKTRWIVKDLAALNYSTPTATAGATDRLRWLQLYLGISKLREPDRDLARRIMAKTRRIARHDQRMRSARQHSTDGKA